MTLSLRISRSGLALIKSFEGFRERAARLPDGRWVIGHGHVRSAREGVRVTPEDAEMLLVSDLKPIEHSLEDLLFSPLNQNQHDALVSFVFNISLGLFRDSEVLRRLNVGDHLGAASAMDAWRKARINGHLDIVDALVRRRAIEKALFLEHPDGRAKATTPLVAPQLDKGLIGTSNHSPEVNGSHSDFKINDVDGMTSEIERLLASANIKTEAPTSSLNNDILESSEPQEPELEENEIVFIGESDEDVFSAIGVEVDEALNNRERLAESKTDENAYSGFRSAALASEKIDRIFANDDVAEDKPKNDADDVAQPIKSIPFSTIERDLNDEIEAANDTVDFDDKASAQQANSDEKTVINEEEKQETPEEVILSILAENAAQNATSTSAKTPEEAAQKVGKRLAEIFEPDLLVLTDEVKGTDDETLVEDQEVSLLDAWSLSQGLTNDSDDIEKFEAAKAAKKQKKGYGYASTAITADTLSKGDNQRKPTSEPVGGRATKIAPDFIEGKATGSRVWLGVMFASIAVIILGIVDFYKKAQPGQIVSQSDIAFGPLMIALGGVVFLMAAYFIVSRRAR